MIFNVGVRQSLLLDGSLFDSTANNIELTVNIDGLPLFRSSPVQFWPILGSVGDGDVFIIALFKGIGKPDSCSAFLEDFVTEITSYCLNGIEIHGKIFKFELHCILADAPARAYIIRMKYHTGYYSCSKCTVSGITRGGRVCFPFIDDGEER